MELFKIQFQKEVDQSEEYKKKNLREYDSIVTFPLNIGLTGVCIETNKTIFFNEGTRMGQFQNEIDNCAGQNHVESLMISPIRSQDG